MKAMVYDRYGSATEVLRIEEVEVPEPKEDEVRVRVRAVSVNASDIEFLTARPAYVRSWGLLRPKHPILGSDIAGTVEAVGRNVTAFAVGDEVFGDILYTWGAFAEHACAKAKELTKKPPGLSFVDAATLPQAASVALQALGGEGAELSGREVLINGAGGGSGTFAIQLAKRFGATVTGVDAGEKLDTMRSVGADRVLDYRREDFTRSGARWDLVVDFVAARSVFACRHALREGGAYRMVGGSLPHILGAVVFGPILSRLGSRELGLCVCTPNEGLAYLAGLVEAGELRPVVDACYPLGEAPEALRRLEAGEVLGKVVVTME